MSDSKYLPEEVAALGEAIYDSQIRSKVEPTCRGMYLVLDIESGEYELDSQDVLASKRMLGRKPHAVLYGLRVGYPAAYHLGGFKKVQQG